MNDHLRVPRLNWHTDMPEGRSPFCKHETRALKVTLHSSGLKGLSDNEQEAYELLLALLKLPDFEVLQFEEGFFPQIQWVLGDSEYDGIHIDYVDGGWRKNGINLGQVKRLAATDDRCSKLYQNFLSLEAHSELNQDIFVSGSADILAIRDDHDSYNIRTPSESLRIVGLLLRSRDNWAYGYQGNCVWNADRRRFYWTIMRSKLPAMWKYHAECREAGGFEGALTGLVSSVMERCYTLTQVVDELGKEFFGDGDHEVILYHFNYFSLLASGVLDALARITHDVYQLGGSKNSAGFNLDRRVKFSKDLQSKAPALHSVVSASENAALINLIHSLRNTIHGAGHTTQREASTTSNTHVILSSEVGNEIWKYGQSIGCNDFVGLTRRHCESYSINGIDQGSKTEFIVEPYNFSTFVLERAFKLVNAIAENTDIAVQKNLPVREHAMPGDWKEPARRFEMLGGFHG
ncbi:hypothetical protein FE236_00555 [Mariprofundus erugo]|uniref:hypothetical protein n=1 Tax=Mariprofundus erugo TaxID=2528639 RepID=UPI0010FDF2E0|nr:hypothetical protein [Mariprofundus erugo]TLS78285.1 hypothetical protein FE236_00555 [Mariprofundus erugo]